MVLACDIVSTAMSRLDTLADAVVRQPAGISEVTHANFLCYTLPEMLRRLGHGTVLSRWGVCSRV